MYCRRPCSLPFLTSLTGESTKKMLLWATFDSMNHESVMRPQKLRVELTAYQPSWYDPMLGNASWQLGWWIPWWERSLGMHILPRCAESIDKPRPDLEDSRSRAELVAWGRVFPWKCPATWWLLERHRNQVSKWLWVNLNSRRSMWTISQTLYKKNKEHRKENGNFQIHFLNHHKMFAIWARRNRTQYIDDSKHTVNVSVSSNTSITTTSIIYILQLAFQG